MEKSTKFLLFACLFVIAISYTTAFWPQHSDLAEKQDKEFTDLVNKIMMFDSTPNGFQIEISRTTDSLETSCRPKDLEGWENFGFIELEFPIPVMVDEDLVFLSIIKLKNNSGIAARLNSHNYGENIWSGSTCPFHAGLEGLTPEGAFFAGHYSDDQIDSINCVALIMANQIVDMHIESLTKE